MHIYLSAVIKFRFRTKKSQYARSETKASCRRACLQVQLPQLHSAEVHYLIITIWLIVSLEAAAIVPLVPSSEHTQIITSAAHICAQHQQECCNKHNIIIRSTARLLCMRTALAASSPPELQMAIKWVLCLLVAFYTIPIPHQVVAK